MKRFHIPNAAYHITTNTKDRIPFFQEDVLASVLENTVINTLPSKESKLIGYKINLEHLHLIIQVKGHFTISQILHSVKRVSTLRINQILSYQLDDNPYKYLKWDPFTALQREFFCKKYNRGNPHDYPKFSWQNGFHDQLIRTPNQLVNTISYLRTQSVRHNIPTNAWLFIADPIPKSIHFIGK